MDNRTLVEQSEQDEVIVYSEMELSIDDPFDLIYVDDDDDDDDNEYIDYSNLLSETILTSNVTKFEPIDCPMTYDEVTECDKRLDPKPKTTKHWYKKDVLIKTLESQFTVAMWSRKENDDEDNLPIETQIKVEKNNEATKPSTSPKKYPLQQLSSTESTTLSTQSYPCLNKNCHKSFRNYATLRKHMHIHAPRTFICAECGKAFVEASKLRRHHLVHTGEKPFQCTYEGCYRRFSLDFNLRTHFRIHTGSRPFTCPIDGCNKSFTQSTNLSSHIITHNKNIAKKRRKNC